jgi:hypothetical protein
MIILKPAPSACGMQSLFQQAPLAPLRGYSVCRKPSARGRAYSTRPLLPSPKHKARPDPIALLLDQKKSAWACAASRIPTGHSSPDSVFQYFSFQLFRPPTSGFLDPRHPPLVTAAPPHPWLSDLRPPDLRPLAPSSLVTRHSSLRLRRIPGSRSPSKFSRHGDPHPRSRLSA